MGSSCSKKGNETRSMDSRSMRGSFKIRIEEYFMSETKKEHHRLGGNRKRTKHKPHSLIDDQITSIRCYEKIKNKIYEQVPGKKSADKIYFLFNFWRNLKTSEIQEKKD